MMQKYADLISLIQKHWNGKKKWDSFANIHIDTIN